MLDEIGSRFSDVFGADAVIWVEGPTEVECFPLLLRGAGRTMPPGTVIAPLRSTGDLEGKHAKACADIYQNLSKAGPILPRNIVIILDGDKKNTIRMDRLETVFGKIVHFLPRTTYENYLLHPEALAALLNALPTFKDTPRTNEDVKTWVEREGQNAKYRATDAKPFSPDWLVRVDGALLLDDLFHSVSGTKEVYHKTTHSPWLTRWLIENDKQHISELLTYISGLIPNDA